MKSVFRKLGGTPALSFLAADPRLCLFLAVLYSLAVWRASPFALALILATICTIFFLKKQRNFLDYRALHRVMFFSLTWPALKLFIDLFFALPFLENTGPGINQTIFWQSALRDFAVLFLRLLVLCGISITLIQTCSPRSLGLGLAWLLHPITGKNTWKISLGLSFMTQYLLFLPEALAQTSLGARSRKLPAMVAAKNPMARRFATATQKSWLHIGQVFRHLSLRAEAQATAATIRKLDSTASWKRHFPLRPSALALGFVASLPAIFMLARNPI